MLPLWILTSQKKRIVFHNFSWSSSLNTSSVKSQKPLQLQVIVGRWPLGLPPLHWPPALSFHLSRACCCCILSFIYAILWLSSPPSPSCHYLKMLSPLHLSLHGLQEVSIYRLHTFDNIDCRVKFCRQHIQGFQDLKHIYVCIWHVLSVVSCLRWPVCREAGQPQAILTYCYCHNKTGYLLLPFQTCVPGIRLESTILWLCTFMTLYVLI